MMAAFSQSAFAQASFSISAFSFDGGGVAGAYIDAPILLVRFAKMGIR